MEIALANLILLLFIVWFGTLMFSQTFKNMVFKAVPAAENILNK